MNFLATSNVVSDAKKTRFSLAVICLVAVVSTALVYADSSNANTAPAIDNYAPAGIATQNLDVSGKTIPGNGYAIPTSGAVIFMDPNGSDSNSGSANAPVKSINAAIDKVPSSGGTIVVRDGLYRDWFNRNNSAGIPEMRHANKNLTIQAAPGAKPWFTGTDVVKDKWQASGNIWTREWSTPHFCRGDYYKPVKGFGANDPAHGVSPVSVELRNLKRYQDPANTEVGVDSTCTWADNISVNYPMSADPQMAFIGETELTQKATLQEVTPGSNSFYYDWTNRKIYVSQNPTTNDIELASRPGFTVLGGAFNFAVKGIGFKRYASSFRGNVGNTVLFAGLGGGDNPAGQAQLENTVFKENSGAVVNFSGPKNNSYVKNSVFVDNAGSGISTNGFTNEHRTARNGLVLEGNIFSRNNKGMFDLNCTRSCGSGAVKFNHMRGFLVKNNIFENTYGRAGGFWCDMDCTDGIMVNNISRRNGGHGIFYEISNRGIIANNLVYDNSGSGIAVAAANTKVYNNTVIVRPGNNVQAFWIWDDSRQAPDTGATWPYWDPRVDLGPNTVNTEFANNLIVGIESSGPRFMNFASGAKSTTSKNTTSDQYFSVLDHNIYYRGMSQTGTPRVLYMWITTDGLRQPSNLQSQLGASNFERNTRVVDVAYGTTTNPFVNMPGEDYRLSSTSDAVTLKGRALPNDVADAMGVARGTVPHRGALMAQASNETSTSTASTTSTTTTTTQPASTSTTTTKPATTSTTTTTTQPATTTTTRPVTTTTQPPVAVPEIEEKRELVAMERILKDYNLAKIRMLEWQDPVLKVRAYYPKSGFLHIAADVRVSVDTQGNYKILDGNWIVSFKPIP